MFVVFCFFKAKLIFFNGFVWNLSESFELTVEHVQQLPSSKAAGEYYRFVLVIAEYFT